MSSTLQNSLSISQSLLKRCLVGKVVVYLDDWQSFSRFFSIVTGSCSGSGMAAVWRFSHHHLASQRRHRNDSSREKREEAERRKTQKLNLIRAHQLQLFRVGGSPWQHNVSQMSAEERCILTELRYWGCLFHALLLLSIFPFLSFCRGWL